MKKLYFAGLFILLSCAGFRPAVLDKFESAAASEKAAVLYEKGNDYFKQKDYKNAIKTLSEILDRYEKTDAYEPALYLTAFSFYKLNKFKKAASLGERFIKAFPSSQYFLNAVSLVGESYFKLAEDYKAAYYLTKFYTQSEDTSARKKAFDRIIKVLPELSIKQLEKLHRVFMAEPIDEHILYNLAQIEAREGKKEEAKRDLNLLMRRFPNTIYAYEVEEYQRFINLGETSGRVGIILPLTGKWANVGQKLVGIIEYFEKNKLLPFSMHYLDTKSDPIDAMLAAEKLMNSISVDFLICLSSIYSAFGVCGLAYGKGIPVILPITSEERLEKLPLVFTTGQRHEEQARLIARYAATERGITKFAILYPEQTKYKGVAEAFADEVVKNNREVVAMVKFYPDSITLKWQLKAIAEKNPEAIFLPMDKDEIINTAPQIAYYGLEEIVLLGIDTFKDEKVPRFGEKYVEGALFACAAPIDSSTLYEFRKTGYQENDFSTRFFYTLWRLKKLKNYTRSVLPTMIAEILKEKKLSYIYQIKNGEFVKLAEIVE